MSDRNKLVACVGLVTGIMENTKSYPRIPAQSAIIATDYISDYERLRPLVEEDFSEGTLKGYDVEIEEAKRYFGAH